MSGGGDERLPALSSRVEALEREIAHLRRQVAALEQPHQPIPTWTERPRPVTAQRAAAPVSPPEPRPVEWTASPRPLRQHESPVRRPPRRAARPRLELADLLGARALALVGGLVTLLGIVFFFALAVERDWISPELRVTCGGLASIGIFLLGLRLRGQHGQYHSGLAGVGAGIAGAFGTLYAATAIYGLVPDPVALLLASGIAAVAVATSLAWSAQLVAAFGLIGAMVVPVAEGGVTEIGTSFTGLVLLGTGVVAVRQRWSRLLTAGALVSLLQIAVLVAFPDDPRWLTIVLAAGYWLLYVALGVAFQLRLNTPDLGRLPLELVLTGVTLAGLSAWGLFDGVTAQGAALLVVAPVQIAAGAALFRRERDRDLAALLWAAGLALAALGLGDLLSGPSLTLAWSAEAGLLSWLARRTRDLRLQLGGSLYLVAALVHAIVVEAPIGDLYTEGRHPAAGAPSLLAVIAASLVFARYARAWPEGTPVCNEGVYRLIAVVLAGFRDRQPLWRASCIVLAVVLGVYAASLGILELATDFDWGHVLVTTLWTPVAAALYGLALGRRSAGLHLGARVALTVTLSNVLVYDTLALGPTQRSLAYLVIAIGAVWAAACEQLLPGRGRDVAAPTWVVAVTSLALAVGGLVELVDGSALGIDAQGLALLGVAAGYCALAAIAFRRAERGLALALWAPALALALAAWAEVLSDTPLVLAWSLLSIALALLAVRVREPRLLAGSLVYLGAALAHSVALEASPRHFFAASVHPAAGVGSVAAVIAAALFFADSCGRMSPEGMPLGDLLRRCCLPFVWGAVVLAAYGVSLAILELFERIGTAGVSADFESGHTAVSAFWGALGLALLGLGLRRGSRSFRLAGFAVFGVSLAKIFLYDLSSLSSVARALSFLAVGSVLLLAGYLYQRATAGQQSPGPTGAPR
jgi:uncharacterized membrane protein